MKWMKNTGLYVDIAEYQKNGIENVTVYRYDRNQNKWFIFPGNTPVSKELLPVPEHEMWPLRPIQR